MQKRTVAWQWKRRSALGRTAKACAKLVNKTPPRINPREGQSVSIASPSAGVRAREPTSCSTMFLVRFSPTDSPLALPAVRPSPSAPPSMPDPVVRDSNALGLGLGLP